MPNKSDIAWTEYTWNPFVGCSRVSEGCRHCYALRQAARCAGFGLKAYEGVTKKGEGPLTWTGKINRNSAAVWRKPYQLLRPSKIFVNSMSDFWHLSAPDVWRREALWIMSQTPEHTYQILTKRPENIAPQKFPDNVWLGVTIEDARAEKRIDILRRVPCRVRFLSAEPLIGALRNLNLTGIHWVIIGAESGPGMRPCDLDWVRQIADQCRAQKTALFVKQLHINGRLSRDPQQWPADLRVREYPR